MRRVKVKSQDVSMTPRPQWTNIHTLLRDLPVEGKSTAEKTKSLAEYISHKIKGRPGKRKHWRDRDADERPRYLRPPRNDYAPVLPKKECELMVRDIWRKKVIHDRKMESEGRRMSEMNDFVHIYLSERYGGNDVMLCEMGWAFRGALEQHREDADLEMMHMILEDELSEDVYREQMEYVDKMAIWLIMGDMNKNDGGVSGRLEMTEMENRIKTFDSSFTRNQITELVATFPKRYGTKAEIAVDGDSVIYPLLFREDENLNDGPFTEALRDIFTADRLGFISQIESTLKKIAKSHGHSISAITGAEAFQAIREVDPKMPLREAREAVNKGFQTKSRGGVSDDETIHLDSFISGLRSSNVKRTPTEVDINVNAWIHDHPRQFEAVRGVRF